jgi:hypothetical protein
MSVSGRVQEALAKLAAEDYENSAVQISIALDATAKRIFGAKSKVGERFRNFVNEHEEFLIYAALGYGARIKFDGIKGPGMRFGNRGDLGRILYKYVRNALLHEGDVSSEIQFKKGTVLGNANGKFILCSELLVGLTLVVVGAKPNARERLNKDVTLTTHKGNVRVNEHWGDFEAICSAIGYK